MADSLRRSIGELKFVVAGSYVMDCFVRTPQLPVWGSEYEVRSVRTSPGGKALNQAVALARLGAQVTAVGVVGDDGCGRDILAVLQREGVDAGGVERRESVSTAVCVCLVSDAGESAILWRIDDDVAVTPGTVRQGAAAIAQADAVLLTFEMPPESIRQAIMTASDQRTSVIVQPAPVLCDRATGRAMPWDRVDLLVPNEAEARALLDGRDSEIPADRLAGALARQLSVPKIAVTLGASGCVFHAEGRDHAYPAPEIVAVDTTGAGDAFVATFAAHLTSGATDEDAVNAAQSAAARAVQRSGGHESMPSY
ncbi:MAG TPA: PfkB family carbohydrate kinase [Streptosporangiaceae bacterium]|nr:PfkB family carbohydrate kinase [Streptosporangiaceae bacterium]